MGKIEDSILTFRDLMDNNWDNSNTKIDFSPHVSTGWYDNPSRYPVITVSNKQESPNPSSETNYTSLGGTQEIKGRVEVDIWVTEILEDNNGNKVDLNKSSEPNPKEVVNDLMEEFRRIVFINQDKMEDFQWISPAECVFVTENEPSPTIYRYDCAIEYYYERYNP